MNNRISGNGADTDDAATPGPTGINVFGLVSITGTLITGNVIEDEADDIVANTPGQVNVHLNDLLGGDNDVGVDNKGPGKVDATENWWGCPQGPAEDPCSYVKDFDQSQSMRFEVDYVPEGDCFLRWNHCRSL